MDIDLLSDQLSVTLRGDDDDIDDYMNDTVDLTQDDDENLDVPPADIIDLTEDDLLDPASPPDRNGKGPAVRNPALSHGEQLIARVPIRGHVLQPGMFVQINSTTEEALADFMEKYHPIKTRRRSEPASLPPINYIEIRRIVYARGYYIIRGIPYVGMRGPQMAPIFGLDRTNAYELCRILEIDEDDPRPAKDQAVITIPSSWVQRPRRLVTTHLPYPAHASDGGHTLVSRYVMEIHYRNAKDREAGRRRGETIYRLGSHERTEPSFAAALRLDWRGKAIVPGGAGRPRGRTATTRGPEQRYTFFDAFCGAGGASRGAKLAGFHVLGGVDIWRHACQSYLLNFGDARVHHMNVAEFVIRTNERALRPDVLHISPPCQYFSPAHTIPGKDDESNLAALFACEALITKMRPRFFTLEQTFGIKRFHDYFARLKGFFVKNGYSLQWKVVFLADWGLPQRRQRLIMIGAGPGEVLPTWPPESHSEQGGSGKKKWVTIRQALRGLRNVNDLEMHNVGRARRFQMRKEPYPWDQILPKCITTGGGHNYYPTGERNFTLREYACLQGFPHRHRFGGGSIKRQIGNAFPPVVVRHLYKHLEQELLKSDGMAKYVMRDSVEIVDDSPVEAEEPLWAGLPLVVIDDDDGDNMNIDLIDVGDGARSVIIID